MIGRVACGRRSRFGCPDDRHFHFPCASAQSVHHKEPATAGGTVTARVDQQNSCAPGQEWPSDSKRDKTGANHNQTHNDNGQETGRSNIFAHDDTCASIRRSSGEPEPRRPEPRTSSVLTIHKIKPIMLSQDSHPLFADARLNHGLVSGCLRRNHKTTSSGRFDRCVPDQSRNVFTEPRGRLARCRTVNRRQILVIPTARRTSHPRTSALGYKQDMASRRCCA
jgi:hypothetical protein